MALFAAGCAKCGAHDQTVPVDLATETSRIEQFLEARPAYQGKALNGDEYARRDRALRQDLMQPCPLPSRVEDELSQESFPPRAMLAAIASDFSDPRNYRDGHYAGPGSGYECGDKWGLIQFISPGMLPGPLIAHDSSSIAHDSSSLCGGGTFWGWMLPNQQTRFSSGA